MIDETIIRTEIDNYEFACNNVVVFEKLFLDAISAKTHQGRKLRTSTNNKISPDTDVTPDLVFEEKNNSDGYKAVNEIKAWFPKDKKYWYDIAEQLKKYDDNLTNWEFGNNSNHDIMLTTDPQFTNKFKDYVAQLGLEEKIKIDRNLIIMESFRKERAFHSIFVRKHSGNINNTILNKQFTDGVDVPMHNVVNDLEKIKFYDSKPPDVYTMLIMWDHIFSKYIVSRKKREDLNQNKIVEIELKVDQIFDKLKKFTHESNPSCIEKRWIRDALTQFVEIGSAEEPKTESEKYTIKYRKHSGETLDWIFGLMKKKEEKEKKPGKNSLDKFLKSEDQNQDKSLGN